MTSNPSVNNLYKLQDYLNRNLPKLSTNATVLPNTTDANSDETNSFQPKIVKGMRPRPLTTYVRPAKESKSFEDLSPFKIRHSLKAIFPNNTPRIAFVQDKCLVIKASIHADQTVFQGPWPTEATSKVLQTGIKHIYIESKYYVASLKVSPDTLNVDSDDVKKALKDEILNNLHLDNSDKTTPQLFTNNLQLRHSRNVWYDSINYLRHSLGTERHPSARKTTTKNHHLPSQLLSCTTR